MAGDAICKPTCAAASDCPPFYTCSAGVCEPGSVAGENIGGACRSAEACGALGYCRGEAESGWAGGYCTSPCTQDADCGAGAHCGSTVTYQNPDGTTTQLGWCLKSCAGGGCRPGYACWDWDGQGRTECAPRADGPGAVGSACTSIEQCSGGASGTCLVDGQSFPGGYCSAGCDAGCPPDSHCIDVYGEAVCVQSCTTPCREAEGYVCTDRDLDGQTECWPSATGAGQPGDPCQRLADCSGDTFGYCRRQLDNPYDSGLCMIECTDDPTRCPPGTACLPIEEPPIFGTREAWWCLKLCQSDDECPGDYVCIGSRVWPREITACWQ
ncbi:MAG: hypothetical protein D6729_10550 [Deltaproteobacteria bacterium]|nr:MAG: hypothetical protein D6729_10550 [Deltaproteobacteria bacterium]